MRSRSGCRTCRIRRVKCDETLPACHRCTSTGRMCDGPRATFVSDQRFQGAHPVEPNAIVVFPARNWKTTEVEGRSFDYFRTCAAPALAGSLDTDFWVELLLQTAELDSGIRSGILALSHLFELRPLRTWTKEFSETPSSCYKPALKWYGRSLVDFEQRLQKLNTEDQLEVALISCIVFTAIEFQLNNVSNAMRLLKCGYELISTLHAGLNPVSRSLTKEMLLPIFTRQTVLMACFGYAPPREWFDSFSCSAYSSAREIESLAEARTTLYSCLWNTMLLVHNAIGSGVADGLAAPDDFAITRQRHVLNELRRWRELMNSFMQSIALVKANVDKGTTSCLWMYYYIATIWATTCLDTQQTVFDSFQRDFEVILECAEEVLQGKRKSKMPEAFSFELGTIPPLFFTSWKCRHPRLRRKAVELLWKGPAQEALFAADLNARAGEKVIEIEEQWALCPPKEDQWDSWTPPETNRINRLIVQYELTEGEKVAPLLVYNRVLYDENGVKAPIWSKVPIEDGSLHC